MKKIFVLLVLFAMIFLVACSSEDDPVSDIQTEEDNRITQAETKDDNRITQAETKDDKKNDTEANEDTGNKAGNESSTDNEHLSDPDKDDDNNRDENDNAGDGNADDNDDTGYDDDDESKAIYGTYSYLPDGMLPYFGEITIEDLYPDSGSYDNMLINLQKEFEALKNENSYEDYGELDLNSIGTTPEQYWGIYYKSDYDSSYSYDDNPLEGVENWLVFYKCGTWAIFDNGFENVIDAGVLVGLDSSSWRFFSLDRKGELKYFMEFDTGIMSGDYGSYRLVYELWDYGNDSSGSGNYDWGNDDQEDDDQENDDWENDDPGNDNADNDDSSSDTTPEIMILEDESGDPVTTITVPEGYSVNEDYSSPDSLNFTSDDGGTLSIQYVSDLWCEELLEEGRQITIGNKTAFTDSDGKELEEDIISHTLIILGYDSDYENRMIYSVIEYGDVPTTYRLMYIQLGEDAWASVYSSTFQQDGIDNIDAINEQINLYLKLFR
ncbi:MAG: hypothetical protein K6E85_07445 [Lachnospiraceae bacterium]|nr:hypothetical protein [Lachnospiraceae bacterium]